MAVSKVVKFHPYAQVRNYVSIGSEIGRFFNSIKRHLRLQASIRQLSKLSDHQLRDIGIERADIKAKVYGVSEVARSATYPVGLIHSFEKHEENDRLAA